MLIKKFFWYMLLLTKFLVLSFIIAGIMAYFYPLAGLILGGLFVLFSFSETNTEFKEKILPKIERQNLKNKFNKVSDEFQGFDDMLNVFKRNL